MTLFHFEITTSIDFPVGRTAEEGGLTGRELSLLGGIGARGPLAHSVGDEGTTHGRRGWMRKLGEI